MFGFVWASKNYYCPGLVGGDSGGDDGSGVGGENSGGEGDGEGDGETCNEGGITDFLLYH